MCVVSMVGDHYADKWRDRFPIYPKPKPDWPYWPVTEGPASQPATPAVAVSPQEFDALRKEVEEMKELLKRAVKYDEDNHEPHCEVEDKMDLLRRVAAAVGVNLDDVIGPKGAA